MGVWQMSSRVDSSQAWNASGRCSLSTSAHNDHAERSLSGISTDRSGNVPAILFVDVSITRSHRSELSNASGNDLVPVEQSDEYQDTPISRTLSRASRGGETTVMSATHLPLE